MTLKRYFLILTAIFFLANIADAQSCNPEKDREGNYIHQGETCTGGTCGVGIQGFSCLTPPETAEQAATAEKYGDQSAQKLQTGDANLVLQGAEASPGPGTSVLDALNGSTFPPSALQQYYPGNSFEGIQRLSDLPGGGSELFSNPQNLPFGPSASEFGQVSQLQADLQALAPPGTIVDVFNNTPTLGSTGFNAFFPTERLSPFDQFVADTRDLMQGGYDAIATAEKKFADALIFPVTDPDRWSVLSPELSDVQKELDAWFRRLDTDLKPGQIPSDVVKDFANETGLVDPKAKLPLRLWPPSSELTPGSEGIAENPAQTRTDANRGPTELGPIVVDSSEKTPLEKALESTASAAAEVARAQSELDVAKENDTVAAWILNQLGLRSDPAADVTAAQARLDAAAEKLAAARGELERVSGLTDIRTLGEQVRTQLAETEKTLAELGGQPPAKPIQEPLPPDTYLEGAPSPLSTASKGPIQNVPISTELANGPDNPALRPDTPVTVVAKNVFPPSTPLEFPTTPPPAGTFSIAGECPTCTFGALSPAEGLKAELDAAIAAYDENPSKENKAKLEEIGKAYGATLASGDSLPAPPAEPPPSDKKLSSISPPGGAPSSLPPGPSRSPVDRTASSPPTRAPAATWRGGGRARGRSLR